MSKIIALESNDKFARAVAAVCFPEYRGRKFDVMISESVPVCNDSWSGGSRSYYAAFTLAETPRAREFPERGFNAGPTEVALAPGFGVAEHIIFQGRDLGIRLHIHPANAAALLPAADDSMSEAELIVLGSHKALKAFARREYCERKGVSVEEFATVVESLKAKGYISARGAITPAGKNACPEDYARGF